MGEREQLLSRVLFAVALAIASAILVAVGAPSAHAAFPPCPTQTQLEQRGATSGEVSSAAQPSTGTFHVTQGLSVPDEQCSYQGSWLLLILYWQLTSAQQAAAKQHFAYECKKKNCSVYLSNGTNTISNGTTTKTVRTLNEVVLGAQVNGEATTTNPPPHGKSCDRLARTLYKVLDNRSRSPSERAFLASDYFNCP
jgi:hypothetical protein